MYNLESDQKAENILHRSQWIVSLKEKKIQNSQQRNYSTTTNLSLNLESKLSMCKSYPFKAFVALENPIQLGYLISTEPSKMIELYKRLQVQ